MIYAEGYFARRVQASAILTPEEIQLAVRTFRSLKVNEAS
jgi:hypothetical protein